MFHFNSTVVQLEEDGDEVHVGYFKISILL